MAVSGSYLADRARFSAVRYLTAYVECIERDIVPVFDNIKQRADEVARKEYDRLLSLPAGENWDGDIGSYAEDAEDAGITYYSTMHGLRQSVINLFAVGLFHLLEQEVADLCHDASFLVQPPNESKLLDTRRWFLTHFQLDLHHLSSWPLIDDLRLVANVVKHAEGDSAQRLRERRPELFYSPSLLTIDPDRCSTAPSWPIHRPLSGEDLYVTPDVFAQFGEACVVFASDIAKHFETHGEDFYPLE